MLTINAEDSYISHWLFRVFSLYVCIFIKLFNAFLHFISVFSINCCHSLMRLIKFLRHVSWRVCNFYNFQLIFQSISGCCLSICHLKILRSIDLFTIVFLNILSIPDISDGHDIMDGHRFRVFAVQYNPNHPHVFISGGWDDTVQVHFALAFFFPQNYNLYSEVVVYFKALRIEE